MALTEPVETPDQHTILAPATRADDRTRVLKQGDTFAVFDRFGDVTQAGRGELGLYHEGTRFLSEFELTLEAGRPLLLSSTVREDNTLFAAHLTNPDMESDGRIVMHGSLHLWRQKILWEGSWHERLRFSNYGLEPVRLSWQIRFGADYADIFEVRGTRRSRRGEFLPAQVSRDSVRLSYRGLDSVTRRTSVLFSVAPEEITASDAVFELALAPKEEKTVTVTIACRAGSEEEAPLGFTAALHARERALEEARQAECAIATSNDQFDRWVTRSLADLRMMTTETRDGPFPYAGVPWFSVPFGRDGILTALECLWVNPGVAAGVLKFLAATQARSADPEHDAEPGKILHEMRRGEMAALGEVPFGRYYGSVDSTPLFVLLAGAYFDRTGDAVLIREIWPNLEAALGWMERDGDPDGDLFIEYRRRSSEGLANQGWKDSFDSIFHSDGRLAEAPIALCEVQGYAYAAWRSAAALARALGRPNLARRLLSKADLLRERFEEAFWDESLGTYALALDGAKNPCRVRASNAGHCLFAGIARPDRAARVAADLLSADFFSGFGIRTVASSEPRYNPMAYHNGSVWPHDNAVAAQGFARYGLKTETVSVLAGLFEASLFVDLHRMPELFCGFPIAAGEGPTLYPVACSPQSWSAGAVLMLLQACLGLSIDAPARRIRFAHPALPVFLKEVAITGLRVAEATVDLLVQRHGGDVAVRVLRREGELTVGVVK